MFFDGNDVIDLEAFVVATAVDAAAWVRALDPAAQHDGDAAFG